MNVATIVAQVFLARIVGALTIHQEYMVLGQVVEPKDDGEI